MKVKRDLSTMAQYLIWAMENRRPVTNQEIYRAVEGACARHGRELPNQWEAAVRQTLQAHCSSSPQYNGRDDFFWRNLQSQNFEFTMKRLREPIGDGGERADG